MKYNHFVTQQEWRQQFEQEIFQGEAAREAGNEGKARVCARRAAALLIRAYLREHGADPGQQDAFSTLSMAVSSPQLPAETHECIGHFLVRVEPGGRLPIQADLLADAHWLAETLFAGKEK